MTGITLSTRVGRLSETHFDNCIHAVNSVPTLGRMAVEQHGERSKDLKVF